MKYIATGAHDLVKAPIQTIIGQNKEEQAKSVEYTSNGTYTVEPDAGKALSGATVKVNVPSSKMGTPRAYIDYDADTITVWTNPMTSFWNYKVHLYDGDNEIKAGELYYNPGSIQSSKNAEYKFIGYIQGTSYNYNFDISDLASGEHQLKAYAESYSGQRQLVYTSTGFPEISSWYENLAKLDDSDFSDVLYYSRYSYQLNKTNINCDTPSTGSMNGIKSLEGKLYAYNKSIAYTYDLNPSTRGVNDATSSTYQIVIATKEDDSIVKKFPSYNSSYTKVSFTLTEPTEIKVKYQIVKSTTTSCAILIGGIDREVTTFSYNGPLTDAVVSYNSPIPTEEQEYSFGVVQPGEHFYYVCLKGYVYYTNIWEAKVTPVYEEIDTGYYLPDDISVTEGTEYTYDAYTGEFKVAMTQDVVVTAEGSTDSRERLDRLSYLIAGGWDVGTSTLTWTRPENAGANEITYHISVDGGATYPYTTTNESYSFTDLLGEPATNKVIKIYASTDSMRNSGIMTCTGIVYNPGYSEIFNAVSGTGTLGQYMDTYNSSAYYTFIENDVMHMFRVSSATMYHSVRDMKTGAYTFITGQGITASGGFQTFKVQRKIYFMCNGYAHAYDIDTHVVQSKSTRSINLGPGLVVGNSIYFIGSDGGRTIMHYDCETNELIDDAFGGGISWVDHDMITSYHDIYYKDGYIYFNVLSSPNAIIYGRYDIDNASMEIFDNTVLDGVMWNNAVVTDNYIIYRADKVYKIPVTRTDTTVSYGDPVVVADLPRVYGRHVTRVDLAPDKTAFIYTNAGGYSHGDAYIAVIGDDSYTANWVAGVQTFAPDGGTYVSGVLYVPGRLDVENNYTLLKYIF